METIKSLALAEPVTLTESELDYVTGGIISFGGGDNNNNGNFNQSNNNQVSGDVNQGGAK